MAEEKNKRGPRRSGQITQRGERRWMVRIFERRDERGKRIYGNKLIRGTKKEAQEYFNQALVAHTRRGLEVFVKPPEISVAAYLDKWLALARTRVSRRTGYGYAGLLSRYIREPLGKKLLADLQAHDVQTVYGEMLSRGLSALVVRHTHAVLHDALSQAVAWKYLTTNPLARPAIMLPKTKKTELQVLDEEQAALFLDTAATFSHGLIFEFALLTGMRPEEYLALQWPDIDFERGKVMVQRVLIRHKKSWEFAEPKTTNSRRLVSLPAMLVQKLKSHKRAQAELRLRYGAKWVDHKLVFCADIPRPAKAGVPLTVPNITYRYFRKILVKAKLPHMRLYDLRHSHATLLLIAGEHPKVVSERLGHASVRITMDTYSHVLPSMQEHTATKLENMFYGAHAQARSNAQK